jgi:hypothetical protein
VRDHIIKAAQDLLDSDATTDALASLEKTYTEIRKTTGPQAYDAREDAWRMVRAIGEFKEAIKSIAAENRVASYQTRRRASFT